jgi:signal transduction histidine kinase
MIRRWRSLAFRRQIAIIMAAALFATVALLEFLVEPLLENAFKTVAGTIDWHEMPLWLFGSIAVGTGLAFVFAHMVRRRLGRLVRATEELQRGNISFRIPVQGDAADGFTRLSRSVNAMADTIDALVHNERRLLSAISHEIRSPLARMSAAVEILLSANRENDNTSYLKGIAGDLENMSHLVGVLLEQSRNRLAVQGGWRTLDLSDITAEMADGYRMQGITLKKELLAEISPGIFVNGHPMQIHLILENILGNALFYAPTDSRVELSLHGGDGVARLTVRDYGPGVPEDKLDAIFRPFFRADPSRARESGGAGLGLTLVREACQALGGSVTARNASPGLEVTVLLPLSKSTVP